DLLEGSCSSVFLLLIWFTRSLKSVVGGLLDEGFEEEDFEKEENPKISFFVREEGWINELDSLAV
ncbi:13559_t:CDS:2, partial [Gigaspora margarita]